MNYDYVVVGGGSAGCAVANRLSSKKNNNVLLIEAGKSSHPLSRLPVSFAMLIDNPKANWRYRSTPEKGTSNREKKVFIWKKLFVRDWNSKKTCRWIW